MKYRTRTNTEHVEHPCSFIPDRGNQRCGYYDYSQLPHGGPAEIKRRDLEDDVMDDVRYNREDPSEGIKQLTTGYSKWAQRQSWKWH